MAGLTSLTFAWQGVRNAYNGSVQPSPRATPPVVTCQDLALPAGALCNRAAAVQEQIDAFRIQQAGPAPDTRHNAHPSDALPVQQPLAAWGSWQPALWCPSQGRLLILLLAAGHMANEWNGRTMKVVLTQEGRGWRVIAAKAASLWIVAIGVLVVDWVALALFSPILKAAYPLGTRGLSWSAAWTAVAADAARAPLVLAAFTVLGVTAAVLIRNTIGAFAAALGILVVSLAAAGNLAAVAPWTITWWVSGWMQFRSHGYVVYHYWVDSFPGNAGSPGFVAGTLGVIGSTVVLGAIAVGIFRRAEVRG